MDFILMGHISDISPEFLIKLLILNILPLSMESNSVIVNVLTGSGLFTIGQNTFWHNHLPDGTFVFFKGGACVFTIYYRANKR